MSSEIIAIIALLASLICITVSKEAVKPVKEVNWPKMMTLLSGGTVLVFVLTVTLFQSLSF